jgi:hypothetical protein
LGDRRLGGVVEKTTAKTSAAAPQPRTTL